MTMKIKSTAQILILGYFLSCGYGSMAQNAEETRAKNWLVLQELKMKQAAARWALSAEELKEIHALEVEPAIDICAHVQTANCVASALPVTGLELHGQRISTGKVKLQWETKAEYNSRGFVLERQSIYNASVFDSVVFVPGAGTRYVKSKYGYTDLNNYRGHSFYRIRQVDIDEKYTHSNLVDIEGYDSKFDVRVIPNPVTGSNLRFYFQVPHPDQPISFGIFNTTGVKVLKRDNFLAVDGYYEIQNHQLSRGFYCITVYTKDGACTKPFTILK